MRNLACGHPPTPPTHFYSTGVPITTGYARMHKGCTVPSTGKRIRAGGRACYSCTDECQRRDMALADVFLCYLASDGRTMTTWTGGQLARVTSETTSRTGWYRSRITHVRAVAPDGSVWYGKGAGRGMFIRIHRAK